MNGAGNTGGLVVWLGAIGALAGTLMLVMNQIGKALPSNAERYGKLTSWVSGGLIILGAVIWMIMKPTDSGLDDYNSGFSFYLAIFAGILAIIAGILDMLDKRE
jgi:drug/metabolite transporter (DMT)-like permease